jgi:hypothetical protein
VSLDDQRAVEDEDLVGHQAGLVTRIDHDRIDAGVHTEEVEVELGIAAHGRSLRHPRQGHGPGPGKPVPMFTNSAQKRQ